MTHLYIEQNGITEEVSSSVISKLYELATSGTLDGTSNLKGRLHTTIAKDVHVSYLNETFEDLHISADDVYITFADPEIERVLSAFWGNGTGVTASQISVKTELRFTGTDPVTERYPFISNTTVRTFNELGQFESIKTIAGQVFENATNLESIDLSNIQYIGWQSFVNTKLTGTLNLPSIKKIGDTGNQRGQCFQNCKQITSVTIGPNIEVIGADAFNGCTSLQTVTGLNNLMSMPNGGVFRGCTSLTSADIDYSKVTAVPGYNFDGCTNLTNIGTNFSEVLSVGERAFRNCQNLNMVINSSILTSIEAEAFANTGVTSITLSGLVTLGGGYESGAFKDCKNLTSANLSGSTITEMTGTFWGCTNLTSATIPNTLNKIKDRTFRDTGITSIDLKNVTELSFSAFQNSKLTSVDLSDIVHITGYDVFNGCTSLTSVTFPSVFFDWFDNYGVSPSNKQGFLRGCTSLTSADLSNALSLARCMLRDDSALTTVNLSAANITVIPEEFCYYCSNLTSLGEKIKPTRIENRAFQRCDKLNVNNYIDLSEVTYIGSWALNGTIIQGSVTLPECVEMGENSFQACWQITELHCPKLTTVNNYTNFVSLKSNNVSNITIIDLPLLTGPMPVCSNLLDLTTVYAPKTTEVKGNGFNGCTSLTNLTLDFEHITSIGSWGFANCTGLNGQLYDFGSSVTSIGVGAFEGTSISFILRNNEVVSVPNNWGNDPLSQTWTGYVYVPDNLVNDYKQAFGWNQHTSQIKGISELPIT